MIDPPGVVAGHVDMWTAEPSAIDQLSADELCRMIRHAAAMALYGVDSVTGGFDTVDPKPGYAVTDSTTDHCLVIREKSGQFPNGRNWSDYYCAFLVDGRLYPTRLWTKHFGDKAVAAFGGGGYDRQWFVVKR